ncbi:hypothetical protein TRFO_34758 [Tritrichomonas foetus]|uniref:PSP1 C-terminal domain-containing protein n=1 Tax=Tritrichomonas foetus TaxID=1144522 RepID=A0A1J4JKH3_9EUKA|nr:hypothetical protein TRFO_34758 [Tritrichomonas foetus]|eukprot:OHS98895.1 hypothetical protein TRFO_34758 [Tritrichomonas foetus]
MTQGWEIIDDYNDHDFYTNNDQVNQQSIAPLLPSALKEVWDDGAPQNKNFDISTSSPAASFGGQRRQNGNHHMQHHLHGNINASTSPGGSRNRTQFPFSESAPVIPYSGSTGISEDMTFMGEIEHDGAAPQSNYYVVQFHPFRNIVFRASPNMNLEVGDYVLTEADRGLDIGTITAVISKPTQRDTKSAKMIIRKAAQNEIAQLPQKVERETRALQLCQSKAREFNLPMEITGAEFQFDGKKLIYYYTASSYVDFRSLVKSLFKIYGIRIWMVWYDGSHPVQDVFAHTPGVPNQQ